MLNSGNALIWIVLTLIASVVLWQIYVSLRRIQVAQKRVVATFNDEQFGRAHVSFHLPSEKVSSWFATLNAGSLKPPGKQYDLLLHKNGDITDNCRNLSEKPRNLGTVVAGDNAAVTLNNIENRWQVDGNVDSLAGRALVLRHRDTDLPATCAVIGHAQRQ